MLYNLILRNRSYRRFYQNFPVNKKTLKALVDFARLSPSAANLQPLKYVLSSEPEKNSLIFQHLGWAGYLKDWPGPAEGEKPPAYIVILGDTEISGSFGCDDGIAAESVLLGAAEKGLGGCIIGSVNREGLKKDLNIPLHYEILLVIAIGKPKERVVLEEIASGGDIKYWRDKKEKHHVPKRRLDDIIIE